MFTLYQPTKKAVSDSASMNKLRWACRRGMLELDLVLKPFLENHFTGLSKENQQLFVMLLNEQDQDLFNWFIHRHEPTTDDLKFIVALIRSTLH